MDTANTDSDRRRAIFPHPPEPGPEQEEFAPYPHRLTQPDVAGGRLMGGVKPKRDQGQGKKIEGEELRPPEGPFPTDEGWKIVHEHKHYVQVETHSDLPKSHRAVRVTIDNTQPAWQVLPTDSARVRATILNESGSASVVAIGERPSGGSLFGTGAEFRLAAGASQDIRDIEEVWASCDGTHTASLSIWVTRKSPDPGDAQG